MQQKPSVTPAVTSGIVHDTGAIASPRCLPLLSLRQGPTNYDTCSYVWCNAGHAFTSSSVCSLLGRVESDCHQYWLIYKWPVSLAPSIQVPLLLCTPQGSCPCRMCPWWLHKSMTTLLRHMTHFWDTMTWAITDLRCSAYQQCTVMYHVHLSKQWYLQLCVFKPRMCDESHLAPHKVLNEKEYKSHMVSLDCVECTLLH